MRHLLFTALLAVGAVAPSFAADTAAADHAAKAENTVCVCGMPVDATSKTTTVEVDGTKHTIAACSDGCMTTVKSDPKKALQAIEAHNKKNDGVKAK